jgi:hypothetical protein
MPKMRRLIVPPVLAALDRYHRDPLEQLFGATLPRSPIDPSLKFLFLCFTNRCGSNYLARLIASTGVLNVAEEVFNAATVQEHARREALPSLQDYVNFLGRRLTMSGWLTAKLGIEQLVMLAEAGILDAIIDRTQFLLIERQDTAAQAVSRLVAMQNGAWTPSTPRRCRMRNSSMRGPRSTRSAPSLLSTTTPFTASSPPTVWRRSISPMRP